jgi:hypothetical protein
MLQLVLYMFCVMLEEEVSSQKKGFVIVANGKVRRSPWTVLGSTLLLFAYYFNTPLLSLSLHPTTRISSLPSLTASYLDIVWL